MRCVRRCDLKKCETKAAVKYAGKRRQASALEENKEEVKENKYIIPEWTSSNDWNYDNVKRNIILNIDDYLQ